jgi:hypothetical protein
MYGYEDSTIENEIYYDSIGVSNDISHIIGMEFPDFEIINICQEKNEFLCNFYQNMVRISKEMLKKISAQENYLNLIKVKVDMKVNGGDNVVNSGKKGVVRKSMDGGSFGGKNSSKKNEGKNGGKNTKSSIQKTTKRKSVINDSESDNDSSNSSDDGSSIEMDNNSNCYKSVIKKSQIKKQKLNPTHEVVTKNFK